MKALIRGTETITEPFPQWVIDNMAFMIGAEKDIDGKPIKGDGWTLIEDYIPPKAEYDESN